MKTLVPLSPERLARDAAIRRAYGTGETASEVAARLKLRSRNVVLGRWRLDREAGLIDELPRGAQDYRRRVARFGRAAG